MPSGLIRLVFIGGFLWVSPAVRLADIIDRPGDGWIKGVAEGFDRSPTNQLPPGWTSTLTGEGKPCWRIVADATAPSPGHVLRQSGEATYPLCVRPEPAIQDGFVEVKFKAIAGKADQAGGVVWRYRDPAHYYLCRANALENNVVLYKVEGGKRQALDIVGRTGGYGINEPVAIHQWHTLRVEFRGNRFKVFLNGKALFEVEDPTFPSAGGTGLWTKADSVTLFDDFRGGE